MKKQLTLSFIFGFWILAFGFTQAVWAYPAVLPATAVNGPTGLVRIPSADVLPYKNFNVGMDYGARWTTNSVSTEGVICYKMNLGSFHGVELGVVGGTEQTSGQLREGVYVNMKLSLSSGEEQYPMLLAIGVENLFSRTLTDVYMVATKYFKQGPKATFGFSADFPNNKFRPLGMAGVEFPLADTLFLLADGMIGESLSQLNAGARFYFTPIFAVSLSGLNVLDGKQAKDARTALIGFTWANPF
jgi:hypothetical protein